MNLPSNNPFADLEDVDKDGNVVFEDGPAAITSEAAVVDPDATELDLAKGSKNTTARYKENCPKCRGTGYWKGGSPFNPVHRVCFACKGEGFRMMKTPLAAREKARKNAADRKTAKLEQWVEGHVKQVQWIADNQSWNNFAQSLNEQLSKKGELSPGQLAAIDRAIEKDATRKAEKAAAAEKLNAEKGSDLDVSVLSGYYAVPDGDTRLKLRVTHPRKDSNWFGHTFVNDGGAYGSRQDFGRQAPGEHYVGDVQEQLAAILADPIEAQAAYGQLTGTCGTCGRHLEDKVSVEIGIGPVCRKKLGVSDE